MENMNVKTGDTVVVITGKDAGKKGKVLKVSPKTHRIVVEGVNIVTKHHKARTAQDKSEKRKVEGSIDVSNVMIVCPKCGKATRVKHQVVDGKKIRVCKCGSSLDEKVKADKKAASKKADAKATEAPVAEEAKVEAKAETKAASKKAPAAKTATKAAPKAEKATKAASSVKKATAAKSSQRGV